MGYPRRKSADGLYHHMMQAAYHAPENKQMEPQQLPSVPQQPNYQQLMGRQQHINGIRDQIMNGPTPNTAVGGIAQVGNALLSMHAQNKLTKQLAQGQNNANSQFMGGIGNLFAPKQPQPSAFNPFLPGKLF